jgi:hypothetical protein
VHLIGIVSQDFGALFWDHAWSAWNYHLMDEEFNGGQVIPHGSIKSWTRYPPDECLFRQEGPCSSWTSNLPGEWASARNCLLMYEESTWGKGFHQELPAHLHWFRQVRAKCSEIPNGNNSRITSSNSSMLPMPT